MRSVIFLVVVFAAVCAMATPPLPLQTMQMEWRGPDTLVVIIDSRMAMREQAQLIVATEASSFEVPVLIVEGRNEVFARVDVVADTEPVSVRVMMGESALLSDRIHIRRETNGDTRIMSRQEVEEMYAAQRRKERERSERARIEDLRKRVRENLERGRRPTCSADSAELWNRAVVEELGAEAPQVCRDLVAANER